MRFVLKLLEMKIEVLIKADFDKKNWWKIVQLEEDWQREEAWKRWE